MKEFFLDGHDQQIVKSSTRRPLIVRGEDEGLAASFHTYAITALARWADILLGGCCCSAPLGHRSGHSHSL